MFSLLQKFKKQLETNHFKRLKKLAKKTIDWSRFSKAFRKFSESFWKVADEGEEEIGS